MKSSVILKSERSMINMVRMPSRREWEVEEGCTIHLISSNRSLVVVEVPLEVCPVMKLIMISVVVIIVSHMLFARVFKVVAAVGAGGSVGGRM